MRMAKTGYNGPIVLAGDSEGRRKESGGLRSFCSCLVIDKFERNCSRVEHAMTTWAANRFLLRHWNTLGSEDREHAVNALDDLLHHIPLIGTMTARNSQDILELL